MFTPGGRIVPFLAVSLAVHAVALIATDTQKLSIAASRTGEGRMVAVRLAAAESPAAGGTAPAPSERLQPDDGEHARRGDMAPAAGERHQGPGQAGQHDDERQNREVVTETATRDGSSGSEDASEARVDPAEHNERSNPVEAAAGDSRSTDDRSGTAARSPPPAGSRSAASEVARADTGVDGAEPSRMRPDRDAHESRSPQSGAARDDTGDAPRSAVAERVRSDIAAALARHFRYPRLARRQGWEGRVVLVFRVHPDGRISDVRVRESSGRAILDEAAVHALEQVDILQGVRDGQIETTVSLTLPVTYRLQSA